MPHISVVVPIYNVEDFLEECLRSLARQTMEDLEVVMVDDGSKDRSAQIAEDFAGRDGRFKLVRQANGGLSAARNTGIDAATGELLAFVDSDDLVPRNAYELLSDALAESGSDFATGDVVRFNSSGQTRARFLAGVFSETRLGTHITRDRKLLYDRTAWNKLFRRSFWDEHRLRFPEGRVHEDIPVMLPAHFLARSVDALAEPVYLWRTREAGELSITQRRLEHRVLRDRVAAVREVTDFLKRQGPPGTLRWYEESVVRDDLKYHVNVLPEADDEYRAMFLDLVNDYLDGTEEGIYEPLRAIERLKWHLVRRRLLPELLEVIRFQREELRDTPAVQAGKRWYGDYPYREDTRLAIPRETYELRQELALSATVEHLERDGDGLRMEGLAFMEGIGAPRRDAQRVRIAAIRPGRLRLLRLALTPLKFKVEPVHRPDANLVTGERANDVSWAGFVATLDGGRLRRAARRGGAAWEVYAAIRTHRRTWRRKRFSWTYPSPVSAVELGTPGGVPARAVPAEHRELLVELAPDAVILRGARREGDAAELSGELRGPVPENAALQLRSPAAKRRLRFPLQVDAAQDPPRFTATVSLADVAAAIAPARAGDEDDDEDEGEEPQRLETPWALYLVGKDAARRRVHLPADVAGTVWSHGDTAVWLLRTQQGDAAMVVRARLPVATAARWAQDGRLELDVEGLADDEDLVVVSRSLGHRHHIAGGATGGSASVALPVAAMPSLGGELPLTQGRWALYAQPRGADDDDGMVPVLVSGAVEQRLPQRTVTNGKAYTLGARPDGHAVLAVGRDVAPEEQGAVNQRRLREAGYVASRSQPLTDTVVYNSFGGRQYSDSPRAIHEELVRRGAPLEHLWIVSDAACRVPDTARAVRSGSREFYEALARSRYVVSNDHFPEWVRRRDDQTFVQTWHGTPLKKLGFDANEVSQRDRQFGPGWEDQVPNWQYVVSPNSFATPIMRRAYTIAGEILETGYPRNDVFFHPDRDALERRVRERLGLPDGARTVLYAPTFRDDLLDRRGRHRLDLHLDLAALRGALGPDTVLLFRKHHYIADAVPVTADGFVRDVSSYPEVNELLLATDVLVTDYSSLMFDYANTGRPMLFFTYDLEHYEERLRGFYLDFPEIAPGPLLRTSDEVAAALRDLDGVRARYADRYAAFARRFCEHDDGGAAARVVDRVFGAGG